MQNSCLKTSAWLSRSSYFVENGYPSLRFPNVVKMNIHELWTRVTRFNPLWVSGCTQYYTGGQLGFKRTGWAKAGQTSEANNISGNAKANPEID